MYKLKIDVSKHKDNVIEKKTFLVVFNRITALCYIVFLLYVWNIRIQNPTRMMSFEANLN